MDLSDLTIFRAVVAEGGITRAAEKLHRVQSNITTRIRQLEDDLGVELFIREGKRCTSRRRDRCCSAMPIVFWRSRRRRATRCRIRGRAVRFASARCKAPPPCGCRGPLSLYHHRYPDVVLELHTGNPGELAAAILNGKLETALVTEPFAETPFDRVRFMRRNWF